MFRSSLLPSILILAASSLSTTGCISYFEDQPERYNTVSGGKRVPRLNPANNTRNVPNDVDVQQEYSGMQLEPQRRAPEAAPNYAQPQTPAMEPSPLYYYEQHNMPLASSPLPPENAPAIMSPMTPEPMMQETMPDRTMQDMMLEDIAPSLAMEPAQAQPPVIVAAPLQAEPAIVTTDIALGDTVPAADLDYPQLQTTPRALSLDEYDALQRDARQFEQEYVADNALGEGQYQPDTPVLEVIDREMALQDFPDAETAIQAVPRQSPPTAPDRFVVAEPTPATVPAYEAPMLTATPQDIDIIIEEPNVAVMVPPVDDVISQQVPVGVNLTQQPVVMPDYARQTSTYEPAPMQPTQSGYTPEYESAMPAGDTTFDATVGIVSDAPTRAAPVNTDNEVTYYDPAANTVSVSEAPDVAAPRQALIYGSTGPIEIVTPRPIREQRAVLPDSRYRGYRR